MADKTFQEIYKELENRIVLEDGKNNAIGPAIKRVAQNGWRRVRLKGSEEMCRLAWLEAKMNNLEVIGYTSTSKDITDFKRLQIERGGLETVKTIDVFLSAENSLKVTKR